MTTAPTFSPAELRTLALLAEGASDKVIARAEGVQRTSINDRMRRIYAKLGVNNRTAAAVLAVRLGLA